MSKKAEVILYFILGLVILGFGIIKFSEMFPLSVLLWILGFAIGMAVLGYYLESKLRKSKK